MEKTKAVFKNAWPYNDDKMNLPVKDVASSISFYETILGFKIISLNDAPHKSVVLGRDDIQIGLAENGGDPTQDGCFFEVDDISAAMAELNSNGLKKEISELANHKHGETNWKVFFVVAPDGLCYCLGEKQN